MASFVVMVEPAVFYSNPVTALDNKCQTTVDEESARTPALVSSTELAIEEHRTVARRLREEFGVCVRVVRVDRDSLSAEEYACFLNKPDAIFPNNSVSFHVIEQRRRSSQQQQQHQKEMPSVQIVLYPMSRGRKGEIPSTLSNQWRLQLQRQDDAMKDKGAAADDDFTSLSVIDLRDEALVMEGTGAINFTADGQAMFISLSQRADRGLIPLIKRIFSIPDDNVFVFTTRDEHNDVVYHTNVAGWMGTGVCAWCFEGMVFDSDESRDSMISFLEQRVCHARKENVLHLTRQQMRHFAGNCLEVRRLGDGLPILCMSDTAWAAYTKQQQDILIGHYGSIEERRIAIFSIPTIERLGGGSVRCLLAASVHHGNGGGGEGEETHDQSHVNDASLFNWL